LATNEQVGNTTLNEMLYVNITNLTALYIKIHESTVKALSVN